MVDVHIRPLHWFVTWDTEVLFLMPDVSSKRNDIVSFQSSTSQLCDDEILTLGVKMLPCVVQTPMNLGGLISFGACQCKVCDQTSPARAVQAVKAVLHHLHINCWCWKVLENIPVVNDDTGVDTPGSTDILQIAGDRSQINNRQGQFFSSGEFDILF